MKKFFRLLYTLTYFISLFPMRVYDLLHGTEFSRIEKTGDRDGRFEYYPSPILSFPFLKRFIRKRMNNGKGHAVLDIGCGKGFVLLFLSRFRFERVSGIEFDRKLCCRAGKNLKNNPKKVKLYHADAVDFSRYKYYDTFYLYNPFDEEILKKSMNRILETLKERPRKLTVIYCNPVYGDYLRGKGFKKEAHFYYKTTVFVLHGEKHRNG